MASTRLSGKVALITGGNTGIGRAVALAYAREGAEVVIAWHDREAEARSLAGEIGALAVPVDVREEASVIEAFRVALDRHGRLDILVNNAGINRPKPIVEMSVAEWDAILTVNLRGAFICSREAAKHMIPRGTGRIINTCSQLGYLGRERYTAYSASKGGLVAFTRALARELAPHGILVNGVGPGLIDTGFDPISEEAKRANAASLPLRKLATPDDVVGAYVFLASEEARFFCGQVIHPNAGQVMH